jgi:hypothetical protein
MKAEIGTLHSELRSGATVESKAWTFAIVALVSRPLALIAVIFRIYSRSTIARHLGADG